MMHDVLHYGMVVFSSIGVTVVLAGISLGYLKARQAAVEEKNKIMELIKPKVEPEVAAEVEKAVTPTTSDLIVAGTGYAFTVACAKIVTEVKDLEELLGLTRLGEVKFTGQVTVVGDALHELMKRLTGGAQ